jgi:hypothetical protein
VRGFAQGFHVAREQNIVSKLKLKSWVVRTLSSYQK